MCSGADNSEPVADVLVAVEGLVASPLSEESPLALEHSVSRFAFDCTHARHAADAAGVLAEHINAVEHRRLEMTKCVGSTLVIGAFRIAL